MKTIIGAPGISGRTSDFQIIMIQQFLNIKKMKTKRNKKSLTKNSMKSIIGGPTTSGKTKSF